MRKLLISLLLIAVLLTATLSASAATWKVIQVTASGANVRREPGDSEIIGILKKGTKILSTEKTNRAYYKIVMKNGDTGYVFRDLVKEIASADSRQIYKTAKKVSVLKKPEKTAAVARKLPAGEYVQVLEQTKGWARVKTMSGKTGYVKAKALTK